MKIKTILECNALEIKKYFMDEKKYFSFELPNYFSFNTILEECDKLIGNNYKDNIKGDVFKNISTPNYTIFVEKDINYQWRPIEIINPYLYVNLVNCLSSNWDEILQRFKDLKSAQIECCSLPIISNNTKKDTILNWWNEFEQSIISKNLTYKYMGVTDISNCYSSIYTHSIAWAISGKDLCKSNRNDYNILGNKIDKLIMQIQGTQTNGIPQGSVLMDFIAEIVLAFADYELSKKIEVEHKNIKDYYILRYRDDYRIFSNDKNSVEIILKLLTETLCELNMKLNPNKTFITDDILGNALKKDKHEIITSGINMEKSIQKKLYSIWNFSRKYPNSGSLIKLLLEFYDILPIETNIENKEQILSLLIDIMYYSPRIYPQAIAIIRKFFKNLFYIYFITFRICFK